MLNSIKYYLVFIGCLWAGAAFAQYPNQQNYPGRQQPQSFNSDTSTKKAQNMTGDQEIDAERKKEEHRRDSVVFTSKFIRVTNEQLLKDSTRLLALDTGLANFENYSPLNQPGDPKISLGSTGLAERSLLFDPSKTIGFDPGVHFLDAYLLLPQDIQYYRARAPYTNLTFFSGGIKEQIFKAIHTQNVNPQLNVGFNLNFLGSQGFYARQNVGDMNAAIFSWYQSKSRRYDLIASWTFNNLKTPENGSVTKNNIFTTSQGSYTTSQNDTVRLYNSSDHLTNNGLYVKQFYYIGKIDSLKKGADALPTQRVAYTFYYNTSKFIFNQYEPDYFSVFPDYYYSSTLSRDSLVVSHVQNTFSYNFILRPKSTSLIKNELKLDLALVQDLYHYQQYVVDTGIINTYGRIIQNDKKQNNTFQDLTIKARAGYRLNDRIVLDFGIQQVAQGRDFGNFLYDGKLTLAGGERTGKIVIGAYTQNSSPPLVYTDWVSNHYIFHNSFNNQKITNLSFNYVNDALKLDLKAEYYLITDYLYFTAQPNGIDATPAQLHNPINLLKVSLGKNLVFRKWHFDNYIVYQKTDYQSTLRTPELYTYSSLYYNTLLFNVLHSSFGTNVRYNTPYVAPSYAVGLGQFYNNTPNLTFTSYPVASVFAKATLIRTNLFIQYNYVNQGLFSNGYYMVNRYPGPNRMLVIGVSWSFYN